MTEDGIISKMRLIYPDQQENPAKGTEGRGLIVFLNSKIDVSLLRFQISYLTFKMSQLFWTRSMSIYAKLRDLGIEGLGD
jgi:hypothetical protein